MVFSGVGVAAGSNAASAVVHAFEEAHKQLNDNRISLAVVFASSTFNQTEVLEGVRSQISDASIPIIGGSTAGEISHHGPSMSPSVVIMLISTSDDIGVYEAYIENAGQNPEQKGAELGNAFKIATTDTIKFALMVADGLTVNPGAILRGVQSTLGNIPVIGGSAGDDGNYKQTHQYTSESVLSSAVTSVAFTGNIKHAVGVRHGWAPISTTRKITKSSGAVIQEIDHKPAIALYEEFVGAERAASLKEVTLAELALSYPLGIKDDSSGEMLLRAPFYVDAQGAITCGGEISEGDEVVLMMGTQESAIAAAEQAAQNAMDKLGTEPKAAIIFNCHVRNTLFASREKAKAEIDIIQKVIGKNVPLAGFYTYSELAPLEEVSVEFKACNNATRNETIVILLLA